jgi:phosphohistidine phosphatase
LRLFLVHHAEAVGPEIDSRRPLSSIGEARAARLADQAAALGVRPAVVWHSGKLRARQTAHAYWRACNALAEFAATPDLQPDDPPWRLRDRLRGEKREILIAGHFLHLPRLLALLLTRQPDELADFPQHGIVALETEDEGETWREIWRLS